jgi:hypothetical protein
MGQSYLGGIPHTLHGLGCHSVQPIKVPADALEVLPSVHFIFVVQDEDGLGVGVRGVPKLEGCPPHLGISVSAHAIASAAMSGHDDDDPAGASPGPAEGPASPVVPASPTAVEAPA